MQAGNQQKESEKETFAGIEDHQGQSEMAVTLEADVRSACRFFPVVLDSPA